MQVLRQQSMHARFCPIFACTSGFFKVLADAAGDAEHSVKKEVLALSVLRQSKP